MEDNEDIRSTRDFLAELRFILREISDKLEHLIQMIRDWTHFPPPYTPE